MHILRSNCFEEVENTMSSLFEGVCLCQFNGTVFWGYTRLLSDHGGKNHVFLWLQ